MLIRQYLDRVCLQLRLSEEEAASVREELEAHLRECARDYTLKGFSEEESEERAVAEFGEADEVGNRIMRSTVSDRWALARSRMVEACLVLFLPAAVALTNYVLPVFQYGWSMQPGLPIEIWMFILYYVAALGALAFYLPAWAPCLRRGDRVRFNPCALFYLIPALYLLGLPLVYLGLLPELYLPIFWQFADLLVTPLFGILLGVAVGESVRFTSASGDVSPTVKTQSPSWSGAAGYLVGILLFWLCLYVYTRYALGVPHWAGTFTGEIILGTLWHLIMVLAAVALGIPRLISLRGAHVVFDRTRFAFFAVPGLFILTSYALYFFLPIYPAKQALAILFAYFNLHQWTVTGAVLLGLGIWMSLRVAGEQHHRQRGLSA